MPNKISGADAMLKVLHEWGVTHIYGHPGGSLDSTMNALHNQQDKIKFIQVRHEEANAGKHRIFRSGSSKYAQEQPFLKTSAKCYLKGPHSVRSFCLPTAGECAILNTVSPAARGSRKTSFLLEERPNE